MPNIHAKSSNVDVRPFRVWVLQHAVWVVLAAAVFSITFYGVVFRDFPINEKPESWGSFGDFVGGLLNPLVSIFTLVVALQVWQLQRDELKLTREELTKQSETSQLQRKEQRFFDCMAMYQRLVDSQTSLTTDGSGVNARRQQITGKDALLNAARAAINTGEVMHICSPAQARAQNGASVTQNNDALENIRATFRPSKLKRLGIAKSDAYCRGALSIARICFDVLGLDRESYLPLFREQLTEQELCLLALYLLLNADGDQYFEAAAQTHLLVNLDTEGVIELAREHLPASCFTLPSDEPKKC